LQHAAAIGATGGWITGALWMGHESQNIARSIGDSSNVFN
jgi:hypothetical protein